MIRFPAFFLLTAIAALTVITVSCGVITPTSRSIEQTAQLSPGARSGLSNEFFSLAIAMAQEIDEPIQRIVLWIEDTEKTPHTFLIEGNKYGGAILAVRPGILLPIKGELWEVIFENLELPLCDCKAWEDSAMEGECPQSEEIATGVRPRLREIETGRIIDLLPLPSSEADGELMLGDLSFGAEILATIGPYIFLRYNEQSYSCGAAHEHRADGFLVYDLEREEAVEVVSKDERAAIVMGEQQTAFEQIRNDQAANVSNVNDLELTELQPVFVNGAGMTLNYQFTVDASYADSDDNWGSYSRSVIIPAWTVLSSLLLHAVIPPALSTFRVISPKMKIGGWVPISATDDELKALVQAFSLTDR